MVLDEDLASSRLKKKLLLEVLSSVLFQALVQVELARSQKVT